MTERVSESQNPRAAHIKASEKVTIRSSGASHLETKRLSYLSLILIYI